MAAGVDPLVLASDSAAIAAVSVASLVLGYGLLAGLWYFVFSPGAERRARAREQARAGGRPDERQDAAVAEPVTPKPVAHGEGSEARLRRRATLRRR